MEETWYCLYHCYVLDIFSGTLSQVEAFRDTLIADAKGEAGSDGRKLKFYCIVKKHEFVSMLERKLP